MFRNGSFRTGLLYAFVKKTQKTPKEDMELGKKRRNLVLGGQK
ncbi:type II toxin-antitoxin system RelE/ParE family toxin [Treponema vincentii]